jgi:hypothetical protein
VLRRGGDERHTRHGDAAPGEELSEVEVDEPRRHHALATRHTRPPVGERPRLPRREPIRFGGHRRPDQRLEPDGEVRTQLVVVARRPVLDRHRRSITDGPSSRIR